MKNYQNKYSIKGITLVALVITIIVLLILAGISIQGITNTGIFEKASLAKKEAQRSKIIEWLNLKLMEEQMHNPTGTADEIIEATKQKIEEHTSELDKIGEVKSIEEKKYEEDGEQVDVYFYIQVDEDIYKLDIKGAKFIGEAGKFPPVIKLEDITNTTNSITIKVKVNRNENGKLEIYKKSEDETEYNLEKKATGEEAKGIEYTFENLEQNKKYNIKIVAIAENKQTAEILVDRTTGSVPSLTEGDITFTYSPAQGIWTNGSVIVTATANKDITGYTLKLSTDLNTWSDSVTRTENGPVYAKLSDNTNQYGDQYATGNVTNIDTTKPIVTGATATTNSIKITATDEASGIVGYAVTTNSTEPSESNFIAVNNTKSLDTTVTGKTQGTTYYVWVKDEAENVSSIKSIATENIVQASGASYTPTSLTNGGVTVTLPTISGFITKYTTDGSTPTMSNGIEYTTAITISNNCTIKYIHTDGNNLGEEGTLIIENIDKINPSAPTISLTTTSSWATTTSGWDTTSEYFPGDNWTSGSVTVNLSSTDSSGIQKYQISSNNSDWVDIYGSQYTFSDKGAYTRYFRAVDNVGNISSSSSTNFTIYSVGSSITLSSFTGKTITLYGSYEVPVYQNAVNLDPNKKYQVEFDYVCASGTNQFDCDLFPDDLPQIWPIATTTPRHETWILASSSSNMSSCYLRFFDDCQEENESDITITNITLKEISI